MSILKCVRVDDRLLHGQIVTLWKSRISPQQFIIIDDTLRKDEFMSNIYRSSAHGTDVHIYSLEEAIQNYLDNKFDNKTSFIIFKHLHIAYQAYMQGIDFSELQLGNIPMSDKRKNIIPNVALDIDEFTHLKELSTKGCRVYIQVLPNASIIEFKKISEKFK